MVIRMNRITSEWCDFVVNYWHKNFHIQTLGTNLLLCCAPFLCFWPQGRIYFGVKLVELLQCSHVNICNSTSENNNVTIMYLSVQIWFMVKYQCFTLLRGLTTYILYISQIKQSLDESHWKNPECRLESF